MEKPLYCPNYTRVAYVVNHDKSVKAVRLRCKKWDCEFCAAKNASIWRAHLLKKLPSVSKEWWFLTLTAPPWDRSKMGSFIRIRKAIDILIKRAKRVYGKDIQYVRTYEKHPTSKALHAHLIVSGILPYVANGFSIKHKAMAVGCYNRGQRNGVWASKTWFKKTCQEIKMGRICDLQKIDGEGPEPVLYLTKYLTKSQQDIGIKGLRHVQATSRIGGPKDEHNPEWRTASFLVREMFQDGSTLIDMNTGEVIGDEYWKDHSIWPYD